MGRYQRGVIFNFYIVFVYYYIYRYWRGRARERIGESGREGKRELVGFIFLVF